ncbi:asparagine synthase (glutamine-hydrolyzing) [Salmonella enterica subsp. arizonae str. CFSAN000560]|uniref:asparagine synthase (glutamine-hydrolyzing) n=1 Tax=Salmonella enterica subsp. arizonae TaxID=59203 RepID=A0A2X4T658_SALER|nr:asparagine synthase (glutamine-hydrolyzing) [Salmonella enterica subsp. arizonae serovar 62:z36:-]EBD1259705.1 asparagine synthase (glutamine-hydrolyzing) [Salmonella enterica subsp. arizonae serovar 62:z4,z32:-]ECG1414186.1 asparagine synthase (glutamine-hydrolyzing) [Salmonella enterica subsp. arizonae str. CFSAN000560]ECG8549000.1 asparagine synthase (glutamine-hydrolyzing) [Salmonella enterica subsp. arizonae]EGF0299509.1 asparagine synthase (glutamine-hydrolyzing) [Salmonella enterica]
MCGLVGYFSRSNCDANIIHNMLHKIRHRGPDSFGVWESLECNIHFGHVRLSIVELSSAGHQPMSTSCGRFTIIFNGEIYNHLDIRKELGNEIKWTGTSDTETLLKSISTWGVSGTLNKAVGMFSFALWDSVERSLYLARDRIGEKPLYYGWCNGSFLFGSELKALKSHPDFDAEIDWEAVNGYLHNNYISSPLTIYSKLKQLRPGHYIKMSHDDLLSGDTPVLYKYWSLSFPVSENKHRYVDSESKLEALLSESVSLQSIADVKVGAFLSGGIDSTTVVAMLKKSGRDVSTFSIGMPNKQYDESRHAEDIAKYIGTQHYTHMITPQEALEVIDKIPAIWDEPFADSSQIPTYLVSKFAKEHVTVALSGDGGDELFMGYNQYPLLRKIWGTRYLSNLHLDTMAKIITKMGFKHSSIIARKILNLSQGWRCKTPFLLNDFWMDKYRNTEFPLLQPVPYKRNLDLNYLDGISAITQHDLNYYLCDDILTKVDRASMAVSLETRAPFLDHRIVEFAFGLPTSFKMDKYNQKKILKSVLYKHVDSKLLERPKQGFSLPMNQWLRAELKGWARDRLDSLPEGVFDKVVVDNLWKEHIDDVKDNSERIWALSNLANFLESHE